MSSKPSNGMQMTGPAAKSNGLQSLVQRVAILNGFGRTLGDGFIGLQALHVAMRLGAIPWRPTLFRLPDLPEIIESVHALADFAEIRTLPRADATPANKFAGAK